MITDLSGEGVFYDGADGESSPIELQSPTETLACASPLRVAPSDGPMTNRENAVILLSLTALCFKDIDKNNEANLSSEPWIGG